ncbi:hypothetical protein Y013_25510 (plasmid) [Rhodococcus pyridinivorans SB3094]|uniref:Uncharacterized protein n=1 Tax=Rhodococcus pyridinivorans SB3094 TaxID=1435356 RepID=V9XSB1_9NOCA|nr:MULTISPECIES: hypothetical protein [Rhodococcus]AHD24282.1 hypothetical protein Y013_25510 [Rhodococcus pyridinivorans SB3094]MCR8695359.1 hypothetical protein [Rhodococcus pyridinivorans]
MPNTADCLGDDTVRGLPCRGRVTGAPALRQVDYDELAHHIGAVSE